MLLVKFLEISSVDQNVLKLDLLIGRDHLNQGSGLMRLHLITTCFQISSNGNISISSRFSFTDYIDSPDTTNLGADCCVGVIVELLFGLAVIKGWVIEYEVVYQGGVAVIYPGDLGRGVEGGGGMPALPALIEFNFPT